MDTALREYTTHLHQLGMSANGATREAQESGEDLKKLAGALQVFNDKHKSNVSGRGEKDTLGLFLPIPNELVDVL